MQVCVQVCRCMCRCVQVHVGVCRCACRCVCRCVQSQLLRPVCVTRSHPQGQGIGSFPRGCGHAPRAAQGEGAARMALLPAPSEEPGRPPTPRPEGTALPSKDTRSGRWPLPMGEQMSGRSGDCSGGPRHWQGAPRGSGPSPLDTEGGASSRYRWPPPVSPTPRAAGHVPRHTPPRPRTFAVQTRPRCTRQTKGLSLTSPVKTTEFKQPQRRDRACHSPHQRQCARTPPLGHKQELPQAPPQTEEHSWRSRSGLGEKVHQSRCAAWRRPRTDVAQAGHSGPGQPSGPGMILGNLP